MAVFLDTNVFLYAAGGAHAHRDPCVAALRAVGERRLDAVTSSEVVQEILYVLYRRGRGAEGVQLARRVLALFPEALPVTGADMASACDLLARHADISVRDAVHVATMRAHGVTAIVSADQHFDVVPGIRRIDPGSARAMRRILRG